MLLAVLGKAGLVAEEKLVMEKERDGYLLFLMVSAKHS